jgi:hypothetical protein
VAEKPSAKSPYASKYGAGYVPAAQYLTELICERIARRNDTSLPLKFWQVDNWKKIYMTQLHFARQLLKLYEPKAIINALVACPSLYSFGARFFDEYIQVEQRKLSVVKPEKITFIESGDGDTRPSFTPNKSLAERLDEV